MSSRRCFPPRGHPWRAPCSAAKPQRPSSLLARKRDLVLNGGSPSFIRFPRPIQGPSVAACTSSTADIGAAVADYGPSTSDHGVDTNYRSSGSLSSDHVPLSAPISDSPLKYDVFINFRGPDAYEHFVSHLYKDLCDRDIETFIDRRKLEIGEDFEPALSDAIDRSRISIVVLTKEYASSKWCLRELARIMECRESRNQIVVPVFLDVEVKEVRWQTGNYGVAFSKHDKAPEGSPLAQEVKRWRKALKDVTHIYGINSRAVRSGSELVEEIAQRVLEKLESSSLFEDDESLVGAYSQVKKVEELLENGSAEVQTLGICGISGSGKTTIAGAVFDRLHQNFASWCFLPNVKDEAQRHGLPRLRNELFRQILGQTEINIATPEIRSSSIRNRLRRKKVLIVLDDIESLTQLELLIKSPTYFGAGSRIIITTKDKKVLTNVDKEYYVKPLSDIGSLELFSQYAFKENYPEDYLQLSMRTAEYAKGLPFTLKVMGSLVRNTIKESVREWESALGKLETSLDDETFKVLRLSYDGLNDEEKSIFLHLACFFNGEQRSHITSLLEGSGFSAHIGIRTLVDKCMITFTNERLQVHDLFRKMATQIVRQESNQDPGKRSRLLSFDEVHEVLTENTGTKSTEAISLDLSEKEVLQMGRHAFAGMRNLKFLRFSYKHSDEESCKTHLPEGLDFLPRLRLLFWDHFPLRTLPQSFTPDNLVEVRMHNSSLERLWEGVKSLYNLKSIDLSYSRSLKELPDFSNAPKVERIVARGCADLVTIPTPTDKLLFLDLLDLSGCSKLTDFPVISWNIKRLFLADSGIEEIPPSIANFHQLVYLDMEGCKMLKNIAQIGQKLENLEHLNLSGCSSVTNFPDISCNVKELLLNETSIEEIPSCIKSMRNLELLELKNCPRLTSLPSSIVELQSLAELNLSGSSNFTNFPEIAETMDSLKYLSLSGTAIKELPSSLENLTGLYSLDLENCNSLVSLPDLSKLKFLKELNISGCSNLVNLSECSRNLGSLVNIRASGCRSEVVDYLGAGLSSLRTLELSDCGITEFPEALTLIPALTELDLSQNCFSTIPPSIKNLQELQSLDLSHCHELQSLLGVPAGLTRLNVCNCRSLETVSLSNSSELLLYPFNNVETIVFAGCHSLSQYAIENIKAFAKRRIQVLASHLGVILNFRVDDLSLNTWMKPHELRYLLSSMYGYGNLHEALIGLHRAFFSDEVILKEPPSRVLSRLLHDFHEMYRLGIEDVLHLFSLIAHLYLYYQGKPSTNFCLPGTDIPEWFCHQSNGSFIAIVVQPPESSNESSTLVGFAISVLVAFDGYNDDKGISIRYECHFHSISFGTRDGEGYLRGWDGKKGKPSSIDGDHLFLGFDSSILFDAANGIEQFVGYSEDLVKATFQCYVVDEDGNPINSCTLKKCAIQPLYTSNLAKSPKQILSRRDVTKGLTTSSSEFLGKVFRHLDLYGAISLGIMNVLGDLSVEFVSQGGYVYIIIKCKNADLLVGLQILNVHLGTAPLAVKLTEMAQQSQDPRTLSVEFADVDGGDFSCRIKVKKCEIRPSQNHVMICHYLS